MPITKYFGRRTKEFGRPLWEIVLNLKNFGSGRYVVRTTVEEKYPKEPSFYRILSVHPHFIEYPETFQGNIYVEEVFRGVKRLQPVDIGDIGGTSGFRLILKEEEDTLLKKFEEYKKNPLPLNVLPRTGPLPPLWREIIANEKKINPDQVPEIPLVHEPIEPGVGAPRRLAEEGEEPTFRVGPGNWKPKYPQFVKDVVWSREAASEKYCAIDKKPDPEFIYEDKELDPVDISPLLKKEGQGQGGESASAKK